MGWNGVVITAPVSMNDVRNALPDSSTDLATLCVSPRINMWAKYKPVNANGVIGILTDFQRYQANYGIVDIPAWTNLIKMRNFWMGYDTSSTNDPTVGKKVAYWAYQRPTQVFRLSDFCSENGTYGYKSDCQAPVGGLTYSSLTIESSGHLRINYNYAITDDNRCLQYKDLRSPTGTYISKMYFGIMMTKLDSSGNLVIANTYVVTQETYSDDLYTYGAWVDINGLTSSFNGNYKIFPILSSYKITFTDHLGQMNDGTFIALSEPETVSIGSTVIKVNISTFAAYRDTSTSTRILYPVIVLYNNEFNYNITVTVKFEVFKSDNTMIGTAFTRGDFTVPGNSTYTPTQTQLACDLGSLVNLNNAYSVRATVTPTAASGTNRASTTATCLVSNGKPREA